MQQPAPVRIAYSPTRLHTVSPDSEAFRADLDWFGAVCRVVNGLRTLRVDCIGARPANFNTVRYSEKLLEVNGIATETVDLSDILGRVRRLADDDAGAERKLAEIKAGLPPEKWPSLMQGIFANWRIWLWLGSTTRRTKLLRSFGRRSSAWRGQRELS